MAFAGIDAVRVLRSIQRRNDEIRGAFLVRNRLLNQIRSDLYLSGTYMRDYLLEPALRWHAAERRTRSYTFLRDEVLPRRMAMISIADQIAHVNERQLNDDNLQVE